tara:strand:- start:5004 stop:6140 length:1137 start_codon:yes stop_codon:yes gene_type:complete
VIKVLLVDTSFSSVPIYNYLTSIGHDVYVMGNRPLDPLAIRAGSNWINEDYSQLKVVQNIVHEFGFKYVVPGCTDLSIEVCQQLGIASEHFDDASTYQHLGNKSLFRDMCNGLGLGSPQAQEIEDFPKTGQFICKPVDSFSGKGVTVFDGEKVDELHIALDIAKKESSSGALLIESFVKGDLYSYSCFIEEREVIQSFIVREASSVNPYAVDTSFVLNEVEESLNQKLKNAIESIAEHLSLKDGLVHLQFILDNNHPYLIEITRRCPGDLYSKLIEYSTGYDYAGKFASYFVEESYAINQHFKKNILRHTVTADEPLDFEVLNIKSSLVLRSFYPLMNLGNKALPKQKNRVGIAFFDSGNEKDPLDVFINRDAYSLVM